MYKRVLKVIISLIVVSSIVYNIVAGMFNIEIVEGSGATGVNSYSYSGYNNSSVEYKSKLGYNYYIDNVSNSSVLLLESKVNSNNNNKYWIFSLDGGKVRVVSYKDIE